MILTLGTTPAASRTMTFDQLLIDSVNRATGVTSYASGKSINAARVIHTVGEPVLATGIVGGDTGRFIRADLDRAGIAHDFIESPTPTRLCVTALDRSAGTAAELIEEASPPGEESFDELLARLADLLRGARALVLSGKLAPGAGDDFYAGCVDLASASNVATIVDATGVPLTRALSRRPTVVKPNRRELAETAGVQVESDDALRDAMRRMVDLGAQWVVVSNGPHDTLLGDGRRTWRIRSPKIAPINPIGSGDAMAGGIAAGIVRGLEIPAACALGVACAAANALTPHAGHANYDDVGRLVREVEPIAE